MSPAPTPDVRLRTACEADAPSICDIYNPYVLDSRVTFEEVVVTPDEMRRRMAVHGADFPWLVVESEGVLAGFAFAAPWKVRAAYRYSVECSVYVAAGAQRRGHGRRLYGELLQRLRRAGMRNAIAGIALPNAASVALHESLGFSQVARFERIGHKLGRWVDVGYWQRQL